MAVTLAQLRALVAVHDFEGFAAAADEMGVSQSAVSHAITALEAELDATLVIRRPAIALTALGSELLPYARSALSSADALVATAARNDWFHPLSQKSSHEIKEIIAMKTYQIRRIENDPRNGSALLTVMIVVVISMMATASLSS